MVTQPNHTFEDHTGELRLRLEAPTLAGLFEEAARALAEVMLDTAGDPAQQVESVSVRARDRDTLLVAWLNELVFLSETRGVIYTVATVRHLSEVELEATVSGVVPVTLRTAVKAATLHGLRVTETGDGYVATVVLDV